SGAKSTTCSGVSCASGSAVTGAAGAAATAGALAADGGSAPNMPSSSRCSPANVGSNCRELDIRNKRILPCGSSTSDDASTTCARSVKLGCAPGGANLRAASPLPSQTVITDAGTCPCWYSSQCARSSSTATSSTFTCCGAYFAASSPRC